MPLVLIHAQAPWGPVSFKTASSMGEVLAGGRAPAAVVDVGERDAADVVREALRLLLPPMDATGQIPATVDKASQIVAQAALRVSPAMVAADKSEIVAHGHPAAIVGHVGSRSDAPEAAKTTSDHIQVPVRRRPGVEVDARAVRVGLGLSQPAFAKAFGIPLATLRDWEQGRSRPEGTGRTLLAVIEARPDAVRQAVEGAGSQ